VRSFRLRGSLDVGVLQETINALCARHEILRTVFVDTADGPRAVVLAAAPNQIRHINLRALGLEAQASAAQGIADDEQARPFALGQDVPFRVVLARLTDDDNILCVATPHIASDAWSANVMLRDLSALYAAFLRQGTANLPPLSIQFSDYASWERGPEHQAELAEKLSFWRTQLADAPNALALPTSRQRPPVPVYDAGRSAIVLPPELVESGTRYARTHGVTFYFALLATYVALLGRYSGQDDILVGSPVAGRAHPETEDLIGFFVNTLLLRVRLGDDPTFAQLFTRVRETFFDSYERQDVPVEQIILEVRKDRELTLAPFLSAILNMEEVGTDSLAFPGVAVETIEDEHRATKFDFTLAGKLRPEGLGLTLYYRSDLFSQFTADGFLLHFRRLLEAAIANPSVPVSTLPLVSVDERRSLLAAAPQSLARELRPLPERFAEMVRSQPSALAVVCGHDRQTYAELDATAQRVKGRLEARGVGRGALVGLALDRSTDAIGALLGIWQCGAAYVPLPPNLPKKRLAAIADECALRFVLTDAAQSARIAAAGLDFVLIDGDIEAPEASADGGTIRVFDLEDLAYVIFTSGSTGIPKGVAVTHRNLASYVDAIAQRLEIQPEDRWRFASVSSLGADLGNTTVFSALAMGGTLHIVPGEIATDAQSYARWAAAEPVDVLKITPSHLGALLSCGDRNLLPRRWLVLGGEVCPVALVRRVQSLSACAILNHYGPTETTVGACTYLVGEHRAEGSEDRATVPIGSPLAGVRCYVLDRHGEPVPAGISGELFVGGAGVAQGYIHRPELTNARFLPDPFGIELGARMYKTGDRVRQLPDGELEFLGRDDDQVKLRGYRVELGEIASALGAHPDVAQSAAALRSSGAGEPYLVGYTTLHSGQGADTTGESIREWLSQRLPDYMVPTTVTILKRLPLKSNGKLDLDALKDLDETVFLAAPDFRAPGTPTEKQIAAVWQEILGIERVGATADFLSLGFHSILAIRALARLGRSFAIRLPMRTFFESKTIERLAVAIDAEVQRAAEIEIERNLALVESLCDADMLALLGESTDGESQ
jgi:amino acid adenylation domain-containing protein